MANGLVATASIELNAPQKRVWRALTDPTSIKQYFFGSSVKSEWRKGRPITWKGEWEGTPFEDKGVIQRIEPLDVLEFTHFSTLAGKPDLPENYHTVTITLTPAGEGTRVTLEQDDNASEQEREHSEKNWATMLAALKKYVESREG